MRDARRSLLSRLFTSSTAPLRRPRLKNISARHRARALAEARSALTDYLHSTRSLPFSVADLISSHSPFSLSLLLSRLPSPLPSPLPSLLPSLLRRFLSYRPVNEFDFFSESIGLSPLRPLPSPSPFLSDHPLLVPSVSALSQFGFPWSRLGLLAPAFLGFPPDRLLARLHSFEALGFRRVSVIGICLAFPWVLEDGGGEEAGALLGDLKAVLVDSGLGAAAGEDVEGVYEICRRIRVFYDAGAAKGGMGALMGRERRVFLEVGEEALRRKLEFFLRLGMRREEVGAFVLENGEVFDMDLESAGISVPECLVGLGFGEEAGEVLRRYPHVAGKNRMGNLPGVLRAVGLHERFADKVAGGNLQCLKLDCGSVVVGSGSEKLEVEFLEDVARMKDMKKQEQVDNKLEFFFSIGFGKNKITSKVVSRVNGTRDQLQERFDCLLEMGVEYSTLCRMVSATPKLLNQSTESIREKVDYLLNDLGYTLQYLNSFPAFLCFDLENRIKPRFNIMNWLKENGLVKKQFSPATILANAERRFVINLYGIHPAAPKQWLEVFSSRSDHHGNQRNLFSPKEYLGNSS